MAIRARGGEWQRTPRRDRGFDQPIPELGSRGSGEVGSAWLRVRPRGQPRLRPFARLYPTFSPRETRDFAACIEWAGVQHWSTGKVGLNGISYYAMNQWQVACFATPHLAAMCVWEGSADWYRDVSHHGGILCTFWRTGMTCRSRRCSTAWANVGHAAA